MPVKQGVKQPFAHEDTVKPPPKTSPAALSDALPEEEFYEEVLQDLTIMEERVREQERRLRELRETYETHLDLIQLIVSLTFSLNILLRLISLAFNLHVVVRLLFAASGESVTPQGSFV